ncbi:CLUMA_CG017705, isoform A [Clunio marinus]|uniref:CLUMA_CG017705, isoform A n=1 Tax=Clunio marinus TaxID=568069 RepID=A0A1J1IZP2_9DIPT|nr:CLUMA_CG017705, isoform A [Clunio marinus]
MANVVPRREPCVKCNNPVFLAERLIINQSLYHRTCFRCARCSSILTLGNFYETEKDHEYCCETCPDEEKSTKAKVDEGNRLSIAQKIALFEKESSSVLKKSLSDEEKSKSLSRQTPVNSPALNNFLSTQIGAHETEVSEEEKTAETLSSESESDDETAPSIPSISDTKLTKISDHKVISEVPDNINVTKELTHGKNIEAIAKAAETNQESHAEENKDIHNSAPVVVEENVPDDIELEFEKLAEDAFNSPVVPIPIVTAPTPIKSFEEETTTTKAVEPMKQEIKEIEESSNNGKTEEEKEGIEEEKLTKTIDEEDKIYPDDLNPFGDDETEVKSSKVSSSHSKERQSLNPFGSCSEDEDEEKLEVKNSYGTLPKPPRPPPPKAMTMKGVSTNPFGSDDEDEEQQNVPVTVNRTPVPTPRKPLLHSTTPEPSQRSLSGYSPGHSFKGSTSSLASSSDGMTLRRKKKKAPPPPALTSLTNGDEHLSPFKTPSTTPRKKRPAPTPPSSTPKQNDDSLYVTSNDVQVSEDNQSMNESISTIDSSINESTSLSSQTNRRLIPLGECLMEENSSENKSETEAVTYRRKIVPIMPTSQDDETFDNLEQSKDNKEAENRQRQSQGSLMNSKTESTDSLPYLNKSSHGKWKRRKGPAPALPGFAQPQRRVLQMLPLQEIRQELEVIEVQQQGLEKQGVMLEKMIRERCEGTADNRTTEELLEALPPTKNPKEVEELILQLFEIVNEKNELFRRQAELMYLRRAHRLEEEQADVEYEIRTLMAQPEQNKTDSDKAKEEALIARLVEIVQLRNEVVDCLDRDRLREAEEDLSIKQRMESHTAKLDQDYLNQTPTKLSKKEKKKLKEAKKLKNKKLDADKDLDTSEIKSETSEKKKKKKKFLF